MNADRFSRIFDVLDLLAAEPNGLRLTEISQSLKTPVSSTHNLLQTMLAVEVLVVTDDLRYSIGPRAVRLGVRITNSLEVRVAGRHHLETLAKQLQNDVYLAVQVGNRVVYVDRYRGSQAVSLTIRLGDSLSLYATAVGKLFAAFQPELSERALANERKKLTSHTITEATDLKGEYDLIRQAGISISREESIDGIVGIAVPIRDTSARLIAAVHVSALYAGWSRAREREVLEQASAVAAAIEVDLGVGADMTMGSAGRKN